MQVIRDFLTTHSITSTKFVIGVSGGADSLALILMFKEEFPDYQLIALTVDHGLRPTSRQEAEYVADVMRHYNIEHHILTWSGHKPQTGIEELAREARYKLLCDWSRQNDSAYLVTAHHLYDQAETMLMRLQRGSGLYGLAAMNGVSQKDGITVLRPLLETHPDVLKAYLRQKNIRWVEDESNSDMNLLRVKIRHFLPILERETGISPLRICQAAKGLQNTKEYMQKTIETLILTKSHQWNDCAYSLDFSEFMNWHKEIQFYFIREILQRLNRRPYFTEAECIYNLLNMLLQQDFHSAALGCCIVIKEDLRLWFVLENRRNNFQYTNKDWELYERHNPECRGLKIPHKLKEILLNKNLLQKK